MNNRLRLLAFVNIASDGLCCRLAIASSRPYFVYISRVANNRHYSKVVIAAAADDRSDFSQQLPGLTDPC